MRKFIITAELRELQNKFFNEEISYSRMVEILNEKAERWHQERNGNLCQCDNLKAFIELEQGKKECSQCKKGI